MSINLEEEIVKSLEKVPHDFLCKYTARILCQLAEYGITVGAYENEPEYICGFDKYGNYFCVDGRKTPREEQAKLDFSKYDERIKRMSEVNIFSRESVERIIGNTRKAIKADMNDALSVGYDKGEKDKSALTVLRKEKGKIFLINMFEDEQADRVYNLLTGGM